MSQLLTALMRKQSLPYDTAADGLEALNKFKESEGKYFLVLMDMNMPVMDGFESTAKIREYERKTHLTATSICALTGVTNEEAQSLAFKAGVNKYLTKPIKMKALSELVTEVRGAEETNVVSSPA